MMKTTFDWLENELTQIKTVHFHKVNNSGKDEVLPYALPSSYLDFRSIFGGIDLFRTGGYYRLRVYTRPLWKVWEDKASLLEFGFSSMYGHAFFKIADLGQDNESPVYEYDPDDSPAKLEIAFDTFSKWLLARYNEIRSAYDSSEWQNIIKGVSPFSVNELNIVDARRLITWEVIGISENNAIQFRVANNSTMILPYLSLGVSAKDRSINGRVWLNISHILPGQKGVVQKHIYERLISPTKLEIYSLPDPTPETRDLYWEFR